MLSPHSRTVIVRTRSGKFAVLDIDLLTEWLKKGVLSEADEISMDGRTFRALSRFHLLDADVASPSLDEYEPTVSRSSSPATRDPLLRFTPAGRTREVTNVRRRVGGVEHTDPGNWSINPAWDRSSEKI